MERSISLDSSGIGLSEEHSDCTSSHSNNINNSHNSSSNSNNNNNNAFNIKAAQLRQHAFELQQSSKLTERAGSSENLSSQITTAASFSSSSPSSPSLPSSSMSTSRQPLKSIGAALPHYLSKRKRPLQRQRPMEHSDDMDYAADLEEEDEEEAGADGDKGVAAVEQRVAAATPPQHPLPKLAIAPAHQKRLQFQKYRQHSNVAMTPGTPHSPPFNILSASMSMASSSSSNCNANNASPCPLPAHSLANHATRSSSTSSATSLDSHFKHQDSFESTVSLDTPQNRRQQFFALKRDNSMHSDSSRYSSLECMLEARKPDPEAILINLGFGPVDSDDILSRIPARFLKPSQVRGIDTDAFVKRLQLQLQLADHSVLGYRGLTGNSDVPPSLIVAKIMQRFEVNERKKSMGSLEHTI